MKSKICLLAILGFGLFLPSCEKDLAIEPESSITSASFWKSEGDALGALFGTYAQFRATFDMKMIVWGDLRSEIWNFGEAGGAGEWDRLWANDLTPSTPRTNWSRIYVLINDCNAILKHVPDIAFSREEDKNDILGQAYFLRAFSYFWLAKVWGDAPVVLEPTESASQNSSFVRNPVADVIQQAKSDVDNSVSRMKDEGPGAEAFFANRAAANMLKADIYLWSAKVLKGGNADLNTANSAVDAVLSAGYGINESYENVFRNEGNSEVIFSVFYSRNEPSAALPEGSDEIGRSTLGTNVGWATLHQNVPDSLKDEIPWKSQISVLRFSPEFVARLNPPENDSRTMVLWREVQLTDEISLRWINKYIGEVIDGERKMIDDMIIYRYAEALLFKAEIENALGNTAAAVGYLNQVAARAYGVEGVYDAGVSQEEADNLILEERMIELAVEGKSYHDIIRFGKAFTNIPSLVGRENDKNGNVLLWPVSKDVISRNPNIVQTAGY